MSENRRGDFLTHSVVVRLHSRLHNVTLFSVQYVFCGGITSHRFF